MTRSRAGNEKQMGPEELRARMGEISRGWSEERKVDLTVDRISRTATPAERLALLRAVFDGMHQVERECRTAMFKGNPGAPESWGTGRVSPWNGMDEGPLVGSSLGAPPCRFDRAGQPQLDYAAMRFIVAARENFGFLLDLASVAVEAGVETKQEASSGDVGTETQK